jgi:DNA-binding transcriptional LysR family regulator
VRDLAEDTWIGSTETSSVASFTARACQKAGFEPDLRLRTDDYRVAGALVAAGAGVTFLPRLVTESLPSGCVALPIDGQGLSRRIYAAHRVGSERAPAVARMLEVLRELSTQDG